MVYLKRACAPWRTEQGKDEVASWSQSPAVPRHHRDCWPCASPLQKSQLLETPRISPFSNTLLQQMPPPFAPWFPHRYTKQKASLVDIRQTYPCIFQHLPSVLRPPHGKCLRSLTARQEEAKRKAQSVLLFCFHNTWPQCRVVKLKHGGKGATNTSKETVQAAGKHICQDKQLLV